MRRILFLFLYVWGTFYVYSQTPSKESFDTYKQVENIVYSTISSFCGCPYVHKNTEAVFKQLKETKKVLDEVIAIPAPEGAKILVDKYINLRYQVECFIELLRTICGYHTLLKEDQMYFVSQCLKGMGWKERVLPVECENAYFTEYQYGDFRMMFIKNILPKKSDDPSGLRNMIEVSFDYENIWDGGTYNIGPGKYVMIQYKDDVRSLYMKVVRATSKIKY